MRKLYFPLVLLVALLAMLASASLSTNVFEHLPHLEDELTYLFQARMLARGDLSIQTPSLSSAYWQPFIIDCDDDMEAKYNIHCAGKRFGKYPVGFPLLLVLGVILDQPWVVNVLFTGLNVLMVYILGRDIYNELAGTVAATLMAVSPIALIQGSTLMGHSSALFFTLLFTWGYIKSHKNMNPTRWAIISGISLGMVFNIRPYAALGISLPLIIYSLWTLMNVFFRARNQFQRRFRTLTLIMLFALITGSLFFIYNYLLTGSPTTDLYRLIWDYDRIGFGPNHGPIPEGHSLHQGWVHTKRDLRCYSRDLFGWALPNSPRIIEPSNQPDAARCMPDTQGISWLLLPFGLLFLKNGTWLEIYLVKKGNRYPGNTELHHIGPYDWADCAKWTALLFAQAVSLILIHMAYWTGAEVYSARYYFEAAGSCAVITGASVSGLLSISQNNRIRILVTIFLILIISLPLRGYTLNRFDGLRGFGCINSQQIEQVKALQKIPNSFVLVIVVGRQNNCAWNASRWREYGALLSMTDPYLENEIIVASASDEANLETILANTSGRKIILMKNGSFFPLDNNYLLAPRK